MHYCVGLLEKMIILVCSYEFIQGTKAHVSVHAVRTPLALIHWESIRNLSVKYVL